MIDYFETAKSIVRQHEESITNEKTIYNKAIDDCITAINLYCYEEMTGTPRAEHLICEIEKLKELSNE